MQTLTKSEIELINQALDALEKSKQQAAFTNGLLGLMVSEKGKQREESMAEFESELKKAKEESKGIERRVILLRAKLIGFEDALDIQDAADILRHGE